MTTKTIRLRQGARTYGIEMVQEVTVIPDEPLTLDKVLDFLIETYQGHNVLEKVRNALILHMLRKPDLHTHSARILGVSPRVFCYHHKKLKEKSDD